MATAQQNPGDILHDLGRLINALGEYRTVAVLIGGRLVKRWNMIVPETILERLWEEPM